ncbi:MAG: hypothetical protein COV48_09630 [Elusimicrobia bacterium CG11_big_fil_rev_8_21_14_0_20_64_6]|nr:MAG: hypothetical protein COV48_09630 [Elusimicrobia bacterium CG11_big_fil_rev_8_21_14_0_20_64_6]
MTKFNRRGSVLLHVLVTGVIVAFIASGLLRMVLMNYIAVDRATKGAQNRKEAEAMLQRALTYWNKSNVVCSSTGLFPCSPSYVTSPGTCDCSCPSAAALPRVVVSGGGAPPCVITIISSDPQ